LAAALGLSGHLSAQQDTGSAGSQPKGKAPGAARKAGAARGKSAQTDEPKVPTEKATFGGGCFWCQEAVFERVRGVKSVVSGYAGGNVPHPSYEMVCTGLTGHAEVVQIEYDPAVVTYDDLLKIFWQAHDPTTLNRQGPDEGTQYRSIILYSNEEQKRSAQKSFRDLTAARTFRAPIVTELVPLTTFYPAESYHQDYYRRHRSADYCRMYIDPKIRKLKQKMEAAPAKSGKAKK